MPAITWTAITKAIYDAPVQPLFNTIHDVLSRAGVPVIVTDTNVGLTLRTKAVVGSAASVSAITDANFSAAKSGVETEGFQIAEGVYYTLLDLDSSIAEVPLDYRTDAAGLKPEAVAEIMMTIGNAISEGLLSSFYSGLNAQLTSILPKANVESIAPASIEWDPTATPASGKTSITKILSDIYAGLPLSMQVGGVAGDILVAWVSAANFATLRDAVVVSYQPTKNGGFTSSYFQYVKEASTVDETRDMFRREYVRFKNFIILPMNGLGNDTVIATYQKGIENTQVFFDKLPAGQLNNFYVALRGAFLRNESLTVPVEELAGRAMYDLPWQCGEMLTVNKVENGINQYKILGRLGVGIVLREPSKMFAYLPTKATTGE